MILVGWSGSGKSTFVEAMGCSDHCFLISDVAKRDLVAKGLPITHDNIMGILHERYQQTPLWQVEHIMKLLSEKGYLVVDGSRSASEVRELVKRNPDTLVVRIDADEFERFDRLSEKDKGITKAAFRDIMKDEAGLTGLGVIFEDLVDIRIENTGYLERVKAIGRMFGVFLRSAGS